MAILDDVDPGDAPGGHATAYLPSTAVQRDEAARVILDRLHAWPEIPDSIANEAEARWDADRDFDALSEWLGTVLGQLDEPDLIDCDCGALLVDPNEWVGRSTVVCDQCGSRFGVVVAGPGDWQMWAPLANDD